MMFFRLTLLLLLLITLKTSSINAQSFDKTTDSIAQKMYSYALQNPSSTLFVHFDKNIYTNNENVWFTAYLLRSNLKDIHHTLSVAVIRNDDRSVLAEGKFVMDHELASGNLFLPDSLPAGNYSFVCYTNHFINGYPSALFIQPVTVKSANAATFIANLSLTDSIKPGMDTAKVLLRAYTADVSLIKDAAVTYFIGDRSHPLKTGKIKTDKFGEATISIPLKQITADNNVLQTEITSGKEIKAFSVKLPVYKKETIVKFYPEGGNLIDGATNVVGWEVVNNEGEPVRVNGELYQNNQPLKAIQTDAYGIGKFSITPQPGNRYYVKLTTPGFTNDTAYTLPAALPKGIAISVANAFAADTLTVQLNKHEAAGKWIVMIHNYHNTFLTAAITSSAPTAMLKIFLGEVPKGLTTFTLLDTLGRPVAERLFFAHFDKKAVVDISTDSASYLTRQKVTVKCKVTDAQQKPLRSLVSIACVQDNRFDVKKMADIESYSYLTSQLTSFPFKTNLLSNEAESKAWLENLLLVKGWRRYNWQDMEKINLTDTIQKTSSLNIKGTAFLNDKPLKKPVQLNLKKFLTAKMASIDVLYTDSLGKFELTQDQLLSEPLKQMQLWVNNKNQEDYTIRLADSYKNWNKKLADTLSFSNYNIASFAQTSQTAVLKSWEGAKKLLDVKVKAKTDNSIFATMGRPGANVCGDYVCMYGILNCPNHPNDGYEPVIGRRYSLKSPGSKMSTGFIIYEGCTALLQEKKTEFLAKLDGIYSTKEFYVTDLSKTDMSDPQFLSTIYWNHSSMTNENGEMVTTFYTSDITGKFRVVIQGITSNDVVYGDHFFTVRKE